MAQETDGPRMGCWDMYQDDAYWQPLPPGTLDRALGGEHESIFIQPERDDGKLTWTVVKGEASEFVGGPFDKLADARDCGDEALEKAYAENSALVVRGEGLDPEEWAFHDDEGHSHFASKLDPAVSLERQGKAWRVDVDGETDDVAFRTVAEAAAAWAATRSATPSP